MDMISFLAEVNSTQKYAGGDRSSDVRVVLEGDVGREGQVEVDAATGHVRLWRRLTDKWDADLGTADAPHHFNVNRIIFAHYAQEA